MESFSIETELDNQATQVLIIPDDCVDHSIFHLVVNGIEVSKIKYIDPNEWVITEGMPFSDEDLQKISHKIEEHFF